MLLILNLNLIKAYVLKEEFRLSNRLTICLDT